MLDKVGVVGAWTLHELVEVVGLALLGLLAHMIGCSDQERGRSGQGSGRLKIEAIRPDVYRLKNDNDDILTKRLEQLCHSFFP